MNSHVRFAPDNARKARPILSIRQEEQAPRNISFLAGAEHFFDSDQLTEAQRWGQALWDARNAWDIARKGGGRRG